jgi:hypothetical protein
VSRVLLLTAAAALAVLALGTTTTHASPNLRVGIADDAWLAFGPGEIDERAARLQAMGVEIARVTIDWRAVQASRTTFAWEQTDALLEALRGAGIVPVVAIWGTPAWANGGGGPNVAPRTGALFATFARAAAERYPWVRRWIVWNEPNQRRWLNPPSPVTYVTRLLNPAALAIKAVIPNAAIAGGSTAPRGSRGGVSPVDFIRAMGRAGARWTRTPTIPTRSHRRRLRRRAAASGAPRSRWRPWSGSSTRRARHSARGRASGSPSSASRPTRPTASWGSAGRGRRGRSPRRSTGRTPRAASTS